MAGSRLWPLYLEVNKPAVPISSLFQPPAVSTKHSVGHVWLSSRYDLAQFSFNPIFHRAHFNIIQTHSVSTKHSVGQILLSSR